MKLGRFLIALAFVLGSIAAEGRAECKPLTRITATSATGALSLDVAVDQTEGRFKLLRGDAVVSSGTLVVSGHHCQAVIDGGGESFVFCDCYEGLRLYDATGKTIRFYDSNALLTLREQWERRAVFACHPEGVWIDETRPVRYLPNGESFVVTLHNGREVEISAVSGRIVTGDLKTRETLTFALAIGIAGCLSALVVYIWWRAQARSMHASKRLAPATR